jgi:hypothetical protein
LPKFYYAEQEPHRYERPRRKPFSSGVASFRRAGRRSCLWTILLRLRLGDLIKLSLGLNIMRAQ